MEDSQDKVVVEVTIEEQPLSVKKGDELYQLSDEELIEKVEEATETSDDIDWPEYGVYVSNPSFAEKVRYVNTKSHINVLVEKDSDVNVFEEVEKRVEINVSGQIRFKELGKSSLRVIPYEDFERKIHLDLTE